MNISIKKFNEWKKEWSDTSKITVFDYISFNFHPEDILILNSLFSPTLVEINGAVFLEKNYSSQLYSVWAQKFDNDRTKLEKFINHVHVYDLFANCSDNVQDMIFEEVAKVLMNSWTSHFKNTYPEKKIIVEVVSDESDYGPTLFVFQE